MASLMKHAYTSEMKTSFRTCILFVNTILVVVLYAFLKEKKRKKIVLGS